MATPKKVAKKAPKIAKPKAPRTPAKQYKLVVRLNDQVFKTQTDNLEESIQSFAPEFLRTRVVIQVTKGKKTLERMLYCQRGKVLFSNRYALEALVRNLIF